MRRAGEQRAQRLREGLHAAFCRPEDDAAARVVDGDAVLPLVGEQGHDQLRSAVRRGAEHRAGVAVGDDRGGPPEQVGLRDEALDADVGRYSAESETAHTASVD